MNKFSHIYFPLGLLLLGSLLSCLAMTNPNITTDQSALLSLKAKITSAPHEILASNWSATSSVCDWIGVTCGSRHRRVTALNISNLGLTGTIPPQLGNLSFLMSLDMSRNNLYGELPHELIRLYRLRVLLLGINKLSGNIPSWVGSLQQLQQFSLKNNSFTGFIPPSISNMSKLETLNLKFNSLQGAIPMEIGNLNKLKQVILDYNQLSGFLPLGILNISSLEVIALQGNSLSGSLPVSICPSLQGLTWLDLSRNKLSGMIPSSLSECSKLQVLGLSYNNFSGVIPKEFGNLTALQELYLADNNLIGTIPWEIGNLNKLKTVDINKNQLSGPLPLGVFNISSVEAIAFAGNSLSGSLPAGIGPRLQGLTLLDLSNNNLSGMIPSSLSGCSKLQILYLHRNNFFGVIPEGFGNLTALKELYLGDNNLDGAAAIVIVVTTIAIILLRCRRKDEVSRNADLLHMGLPKRISYYELMQATSGYDESNLLGKGSFGSVYKGTLTDGTVVAVKVFTFLVEATSRSFDTECEVLRNLRHRNLTKVIGSCSNLDFKALVLEYMPNGSLEKWLYSHNHCVDLVQRISMMVDVASALEYLHFGYATPVVHCDLKPSNILLDENMVAHVSDFGIAKLLDERNSVMHTKTLATLGYMAPEYGLEGLVSTRTDVYSFGIILMETFSRMKPGDEIFKEDLNLKSWIKESLPSATIQVIDGSLLRQEDEHFNEKLECVSMIFKLALSCCTECPQDRINIKEVVVALMKLKRQLDTLSDT